MTLYDEAVGRIEAALKARYNVSTFEGLPLAEALEQARADNLGPLEEALEGRELYRWDAEIRSDLAEARRVHRASHHEPEEIEAPEPEEAQESEGEATPPATPESEAESEEPKPRSRRR